MKQQFLTLLCAGMLISSIAARGLDVEEKETIHRRLSFPAAPGNREVRVDNIEGSIDITGQPGSEVVFEVQKTIRAETRERLQVAQQEVKLDLSQREDVIQAYVEAPYRCRDGSTNFRGWRYYGYRVQYDFEIKVPRDSALFLRTVNNGQIKVQNVSGAYDVENINGGIEMLELSGGGRAYALNGKVKILFRENPKSNAYFGSLNGGVDVSFLEDLSADLRFKTFNGSVYTDFPVTYLPSGPATQERRNGKFVYKSNEFFGVRVARGGPELKFDSFNGNIHILKREK